MRPIGNRAPTTNAQTASAQVSAEMADRAYMGCTARVLNALRGAFECGLTLELAAVRPCGGFVYRGALRQACVLGRRSQYSKQTALGGIVKPNNDDEGN
jgi:hypothetical protein